MNREYGTGKTPETDDVLATVTFADRHGSRNYQRFTWLFEDPACSEEEVRVRGQTRRKRMKNEGGRVQGSRKRTTLFVWPMAIRALMWRCRWMLK